jgi:GlpG protein
MSSILVFQASPDINLSPITERLWQANIPHRVVMNDNSQDLWVARVEDAEQVKIWVEDWKAGQLTAKPDDSENIPWQVKSQQYLIQASRFPITVIMLVLIAGIFFLQQFGLLGMEDWLLQASLWSGEKLDISSFWRNEFYRWWSPALIHLSFMHLLMNSFWWWVLAKEIEVHDGHMSLLALTFVLAVGSAFAQYLAVGPYFAGLSGVTYGLMGWAWGRYTFKQTPYQLPSWLFPFMMITMLVIMLVDGAGMALNIGHESHLAGAVIGVILGLILPRNKRSSVNKEVEGKENDS